MTSIRSNKRVRLKFLAHIEMGQSPPSSEYSNLPEDGVPFLQGTADFGATIPSPKVYCRTSTKLAQVEDILFSVRAPVGEINLADQDYGIGRGLCAIRPSNKWNNRFGWWALYEARYQLSFVSTGSTYEAVSTEDVSNLLVTITSDKRQRAIADYLDRETARIDALIAAKERLLELLAEKRRALITQAVTRGLDPSVPLRDSGIPWLGGIPDHWKIVALRFLVDFTSGATPNTETREYWDGEIPWVSPKDMKQDEISDAQDHVSELALSESPLHLIKPEAVLIVVRGMILAHSFPTAVTTAPITINQDMKALRCRSSLNPYYLRDFFRGNEQYIISLMDMATHGTRRLDTEVIGQLTVTLPSLGEQQIIIDYIRDSTSLLDRTIVETENTITLLKERRAALIAAAVTGQIEVGRDPLYYS
ncbi:MAG: restriction endonuclease subunit S [Cyanobacteriota bacterium]|nr:restriction endonuclease subunit S [Cyanobacteriota bacterium]